MHLLGVDCNYDATFQIKTKHLSSEILLETIRQEQMDQFITNYCRSNYKLC